MWKQRCLMICGPLVAFGRMHSLKAPNSSAITLSCSTTQPSPASVAGLHGHPVDFSHADGHGPIDCHIQPTAKRHGKRVLRVAGGVDLPSAGNQGAVQSSVEVCVRSAEEQLTRFTNIFTNTNNQNKLPLSRWGRLHISGHDSGWPPDAEPSGSPRPFRSRLFFPKESAVKAGSNRCFYAFADGRVGSYGRGHGLPA